MREQAALVLGVLAHWRHVSVAQVALVAVVLLLVVGVPVVVLAGVASLNALVHRCTLHSLLAAVHLVLAATGIHMLRKWHHVASCRGSRVLILQVELALLRYCSCWVCTLWHQSNVVGLAVLLDLGQNTKTSLRRDQARNDFLSDVLGGRPEEVLELNGAELLDDGALLADALVEAFFELIELAFLLVEVLDESPSSLLHLVESAFQSFDDAGHGSLHLSSVLRVPDVVSDELLNRLLPGVLQVLLFAHELELVHESVHVFNQDVIARNQNLLLLLVRGAWLLVAGLLGRLRVLLLDHSVASRQRSALRALTLPQVLVGLLAVGVVTGVLNSKGLLSVFV